MTKMIALTAALIAGTTMASAAKADAVRLGFGFPLGSFVAHSNENYGGNDYRRAERPRSVRRDYDEDATARKVTRVIRPSRDEVTETSMAPVTAPVKVAAQTPKSQDPVASDPATTTVIEKSPVAKTDALPVSASSASAGSNIAKTALNTDKIETADKPAATTEAASAHVCRRYSPAIAGLVDVPCE